MWEKAGLYSWNLTSHRNERNSNSICKWMCPRSDATGSIICCFGDKASIVSSSSNLAVLVRCLESFYILVKCAKHGDEMKIGFL